ncbi:MAG: hypothetical protein ACOC2W_02060 [bacterium]
MKRVLGKVKNTKIKNVDDLTGVEKLQLANKKDLEDIEGININTFFKDVTPEDMMNLFFSYHNIKDKLTNEQIEELKEMCNNTKYNKNDVDCDGYPLHLEKQIYCTIEQYFIDELGWDEEWMS